MMIVVALVVLVRLEERWFAPTRPDDRMRGAKMD